jgi:hypothetical protein
MCGLVVSSSELLVCVCACEVGKFMFVYFNKILHETQNYGKDPPSFTYIEKSVKLPCLHTIFEPPFNP